MVVNHPNNYQIDSYLNYFEHFTFWININKILLLKLHKRSIFGYLIIHLPRIKARDTYLFDALLCQ